MLHEIDDKLKMSLHISSTFQSSILSSIEREGPAPMNSYFSHGSFYLGFFLVKVTEKERWSVENLNPVKIGNVSIVTEALEILLIWTVRENIGDVPSIVSGGSYSRGNELFADFGFHVSDVQLVTNLIKKMISMNTETGITGMGRSKGF
jgi:hypothetical protein